MSDGKFFYPNRWWRLVLTSAEEIVGDKGMAALLNMAKIPEYIGNYPPNDMERGFTFEQVSHLQQAIWDMYGPRGARRAQGSRPSPMVCRTLGLLQMLLRPR
jgi:hypothetical protein